MPSSPRTLTWRDLPLLHRYSSQSVCLESRRAAVGGAGMVGTVLVGMLSAATGVAAGIDERGRETPLLAVGERNDEKGIARLLYLAPVEALTAQTPLAPLIEFLIAHPALRGAQALVAEAPWQAGWLPALRHAGFRVFARQHVWQMPVSRAWRNRGWRWPRAEQRWAAERLYTNLTPPSVRHLLPPPAAAPTAVVFVEGGEVRGVARWAVGPKGMWAAPWLDPDVSSACEALRSLAAFLRPRGKTLYLAVHDAQAWLESPLERLAARPSEPLALLARWVVQPQPAAEAVPAGAQREAPQPTLFVK